MRMPVCICVWADSVLSLLILSLVLFSEARLKGESYSTVTLDAALHQYDTLHMEDISHFSSDHNLEHSVTFRALGRHFRMKLEWDRYILPDDFTAYSVDSKGIRHPYSVDRHAFLHGHLEGQEESSLVTAHLSSRGVLSAVIATPTNIYHIEPSHHYIKEPHPFHMIAYAASHVKQRFNHTAFDYVSPALSPGLPSNHHTSTFKHRKHTDTVAPRSHRLRRQVVDRGNLGGSTCNMVLIADHFSFRLFGGMESTISQLVLLLSSVDKQIYRPTGWFLDLSDNSVSGLGHHAQMVLVQTAPTEDGSDFRAAYNSPDSNLRAGDILDGLRFGPWASFCLAHLFTNRQFPSGLLGLANIASPDDGQTGGICSREFQDFNFDPPRSIIYNTGLSTYNNNGQQMILSEMIRVVGHELGHNWGSHHDPNSEECGNDFLMNEYAQDGSLASHTVFSNCSRRSIGIVLINKGQCFVEPSAVCGDYQVSEGEACDAGREGDRCCTARCTLTEGSVCSDMNSLCCQNCTRADSMVRCRTGPRVSQDCTADTYCDGNDVDCVGTPEPAPNGTRCLEGVCLLTEDDSVSRPQCVPLCETLGLSKCMCEGDEECMVCCEGPQQPCHSISLPLSNGSACESGVCRNGECSPLTQDQVARIWTIIVTLNVRAFKEFIDENVVGFTLIFSLPLWCIGSCLLHWLVDYPKKKRLEKSLDKADVNVSTVFMRMETQIVNKQRSRASEERRALVHHEGMDENVLEIVSEPEDDLPPPQYSV